MEDEPVLHVRCQRCHFAGMTQTGIMPNTNDVVRCGCCTEDHDHDQWQERGQAEPCRPINITYVGPLVIHIGQGPPQATELTGKVN